MKIRIYVLVVVLLGFIYVEAYSQYQVRVKPYYDISLLSKKLKTSRYSPFENPTGIFFQAGEEINVSVPELHGRELNLVLTDFGKPLEGGKKEVTTTFHLKQGKNIFKAPHKGLAYINYYVEDYLNAPDFILTFDSGQMNGVFYAYTQNNKEWKQMLDNAVAEVIDMQGKYIHLTFDVKSLKEKGSDCGVEMIRMYDRIILWQQEMLGIDKFGYRTNNHMFGRISWSGPPNANGKGVSFPRTSSIIRPEEIRNTNWVIGHEFGHVNQVRPGFKWHGTTEITNNIQAAWIQYLLRPEGPFRIENTMAPDGTGEKIYGGLFNWHFNHCVVLEKPLLYNPEKDFTPPYSDNKNPFVRLCPFWQLQIYNALTGLGNPDFHADVCEMVRKTDEKGMSAGELQINFVKNTCDAMRQDMSEFFIKCGILRPVSTEIGDYGGNRPMHITQKQIDDVIAYASKYPKPITPVVHYITMNNVKCFREKLPIEGITGKGVSFDGEKCKVSHEVWKNVIVFEAYKDKSLQRVTMVGTGTEDNTETIAYFPKGCNRLVAVGWDGFRKEVLTL